MKFVITSQNQDQRLDKFLTPELKDLSRSQIQKQIKRGLILVNSKIKPVHYFLKEKDEIEIKKYRNKEIKKLNYKLNIVKETDDYLVVEKPAGLIVHPVDNVETRQCLVSTLIEQYPEITKIKYVNDVETSRWDVSTNTRPGIVHRLDKETSGLLVVARSQKMFKHLKKQFYDHRVKKVYQALVESVIEKDEGKITTPLKKNKQNIMIARTDKNVQKTKTAVTEFMVLQRFKHYTLLEITIKTGRTHQIRAHLKSIGYSVVGDELYKTATHKAEILKRRNRDRQKLNRIFLHASNLGFYDLENKWCEFKSELPANLKSFLNTLTEI